MPSLLLILLVAMAVLASLKGGESAEDSQGRESEGGIGASHILGSDGRAPGAAGLGSGDVGLGYTGETAIQAAAADQSSQEAQLERCYQETRDEYGLAVCLLSVLWPGEAGWAWRCFTSESGLDITSIGSVGEVGIAQVHPVHVERAAALGFTWEQVATDPLANLLVARNLYEEQGKSPWRGSGCK